MARQALQGIINGLPVTVEADVTAELGPTGIIHTTIEFEDGTPHLRSGDSFTITVPVEVTRRSVAPGPPVLYISATDEAAEREYRTTLDALQGGQIPHGASTQLRRVTGDGFTWQWMTVDQLDQGLRGLTIKGWMAPKDVHLSARTIGLLDRATGRWPGRTAATSTGGA